MTHMMVKVQICNTTHKDTMAVAYVAQDHGAEVTYLGTIGTRHRGPACNRDQVLHAEGSGAGEPAAARGHPGLSLPTALAPDHVASVASRDVSCLSPEPSPNWRVIPTQPLL